MIHKGYNVKIKHNSKNHFKANGEKFTLECPNKKSLTLKEKKFISTETITLPQETITVKRYEWIFQTDQCTKCPYNTECTCGKPFRKVKFKLTENELEHMMKMSLEENKAIYSKRKHKIETVFGDWKYNDKFLQLNVNGLKNVECICGLLVVSQNIQTLTKYAKNSPQSRILFDKETIINYDKEKDELTINTK